MLEIARQVIDRLADGTSSPAPSTSWRATGPYRAANASKAGLVRETQIALCLYARLGSSAAVRQYLLTTALPQPARASRESIVALLNTRLFRWQPPAWVWQDLLAAASAEDDLDLRTLLLLHAARQDCFLYDAVQHVIVTRWRQGDREVIRADVQRYLDAVSADHPEVERWSWATRKKLAGNVLSILADYGLLMGRVRRRIIEPVVRSAVAAHLERLLLAEGIRPEALAEHPDWQLWLWTADHVRHWQRTRDQEHWP